YGFAALDPAGIDPAGLIARGTARDLTGVRIGVGDPFLWRDCDPGIAETAQQAVDALVNAGAVARDLTLPEAETAYGVFLAGARRGKAADDRADGRARPRHRGRAPQNATAPRFVTAVPAKAESRDRGLRNGMKVLNEPALTGGRRAACSHKDSGRIPRWR